MKSITKQLPTTEIPASALASHSRAFNAGLIYAVGRNLLAYRVATSEKEWCIIRMAELDSEWKVKSDKAINITSKFGANLEDPRLFLGPKDSIWLAWTEAVYAVGEWICVQKFGPLEELENGDWKCPKSFQPQYGKNDGTGKEKNWQFFFQEEKLFCIYQHNPQIVLELEGEEVVSVFHSDGFRWKHGNPCGGTPPIPYGDKLLTFFHAHVPNLDHSRRYNFGALILEKEPPFKAVFVSPEPIVSASEQDELAPDPRWHPLCIFPGGATINKQGIHIASGVNDCAIVVQHLDPEKMTMAPVAPKIKGQFVKIKLLCDMILTGGHFGINGAEIEVTRMEAIDFISRGRAEIMPDEYFPTPSMFENERALLEPEKKKKKLPRRRR